MAGASRTGRWLPMPLRSTGRGVRKVSKLAANAELAGLVAAKLDDDWSPQQIARWLRRQHPGDADMWVSHESIYREVYMPSRKAFDARMFTVCAVIVRYGDRWASGPRTAADRSRTQSPPGSVPSRPTLGRWPALGG